MPFSVDVWTCYCGGKRKALAVVVHRRTADVERLLRSEMRRPRRYPRMEPYWAVASPKRADPRRGACSSPAIIVISRDSSAWTSALAWTGSRNRMVVLYSVPWRVHNPTPQSFVANSCEMAPSGAIVYYTLKSAPKENEGNPNTRTVSNPRNWRSSFSRGMNQVLAMIPNQDNTNSLARLLFIRYREE